MSAPITGGVTKAAKAKKTAPKKSVKAIKPKASSKKAAAAKPAKAGAVKRVKASKIPEAVVKLLDQYPYHTVRRKW